MKKILVMALAVASAAVAQASYLYWQTDTETSFNGNNIYGYSMVVQNVDGTGKTYLTPTYTDGDAVTPLSSNVFGGDSEYKINLGDSYSSNSGLDYVFYVEVIGYDSSVYGASTGVIGVSETKSYSDLVSAGHIVPAGLTKIPASWTGGSYAAPEPTSAMMILLGLAGLALKRKQV